MCSKEKLETEVFEDLPITKRHDICLSLFHLLNWFRELVSLDFHYRLSYLRRVYVVYCFRCVRLLVRKTST